GSPSVILLPRAMTTRRPRTMAPNWSAATVAPQSFTSPTAFGLISREFASSPRERRSRTTSLALTRRSTSPTLRSHFGRMTSWIGSLPSELEAGHAYCSTSPCSSDRGRGCRIGGFQRRLRPRAEACVERRGGREGGDGVRQVRQSQGVEDEHRGARRRWGAALLPARPGL